MDTKRDKVIVNFSHPLTANQAEEICRLKGWKRDEVAIIAAMETFNKSVPFGDQVAALVDKVWESLPIPEQCGPHELVIVPPREVCAALLLEAEFRAREVWLSVVRFQPKIGVGRAWEVAEVIDLTEAHDLAWNRSFEAEG